MNTVAQRRSDRVTLTLLLQASGKDAAGQDFSEPSRTLQISLRGAVIVLNRELNPEQRILIKRQAQSEAHREAEVRVVREFGCARMQHLATPREEHDLVILSRRVVQGVGKIQVGVIVAIYQHAQPGVIAGEELQPTLRKLRQIVQAQEGQSALDGEGGGRGIGVEEGQDGRTEHHHAGGRPGEGGGDH